MKKIITISVDMEAWTIARTKTPNISGYLSDCLMGLAGTSSEAKKEEEIRDAIKAVDVSMQELNIKRNILSIDLKLLEENKIEVARQRKDAEQYDRWVCGACHNKNFMEFDRCSRCSLPTRKDPKTVIINIKNEVTTNE